MKFSVNHSTVYRYDTPVVLEPHVFRLCPRNDGSQRLISYQLDLFPEPAGRAECLDQNGNATTQAWFAAGVNELRVDSRFELETLRDNPFDFLLAKASELALPLAAVPPVTPVEDFARNIARQTGSQTMPFLFALTSRLFRDWRHSLREEGDPLAAELTLSSGEGSCRDLAVLFGDCCRAVGLQARFVSGYEIASAQSNHPYMHAWSEVHVPGGGWRGYDPARGVAVGANHVAVAAAAFPADAAPISGTYRGTTKTAMEVAIQMQVG